MQSGDSGEVMCSLEPNKVGIMVLTAVPFLTVIFIGIIVILISRTLDVLWAQVLPMRFFYSLLRAPGVIIHELSHVLGCLISGAKVKKVIYFSNEGGSVTYSSPKIPYIGDLVINIAPLFCIPLILAGCTWIFSEYLGCVFPPMPMGVNSLDALFGVVTGILGMFTSNLIIRFNPWFLAYLYLNLTLVLSVAPSSQDIKNAAVGIGVITLMGMMILWSSNTLAGNLLDGFVYLLGIGFSLGLLFGIIALVISSPLVILYVHKKI
ncbi:MAG TPA: DUF3267 domain-containing protein [Methanoregula sp.]|nr:DUF3267 domain-containing protein [Methanoregula sp.]